MKGCTSQINSTFLFFFKKLGGPLFALFERLDFPSVITLLTDVIVQLTCRCGRQNESLRVKIWNKRAYEIRASHVSLVKCAYWTRLALSFRNVACPWRRGLIGHITLRYRFQIQIWFSLFLDNRKRVILIQWVQNRKKDIIKYVLVNEYKWKSSPFLPYVLPNHIDQCSMCCCDNDLFPFSP